MYNLTPLKAIKSKCIDCCGDDSPRKCVCHNCSLFSFRLGKNTLLKPRKISDKQRQILLKNLPKNMGV